MSDDAADNTVGAGFIPVTIDKSHIVTIGERLYAESIEFVRELVNNAYDADATLVEISVSGDTIEIRDDGSGMDMVLVAGKKGQKWRRSSLQ